ncbi:MAG: IS1634 family transposase [Acetobacteraceae bacterium]|nr:IS1634 family transposase [Acetobacteraceae bacterium]
MASVIKKIVNGRMYYYAVQSKRVDGKPRIVWQKYLGRAEDIVRAMTEDLKPQAVHTFAFGAVAALYAVAQRLRLVETINAHVHKRAQGVTVGEYLLIAAINRCVAPRSKRRMAEWYASTSLRRLLGIKPDHLTSQRFWDHMGYLGAEEIRGIEEELARRLVQEYGVDLRCLVYDATNFFTYIDTRTASELPQRGHSKAKRNDLRQVNLALLVSTDFHVPLFHTPYPGNVPDAPQFGALTEELVARHAAVAQGCQEVTLVFDKGNNSQANLRAVEESPYHFVGSLVPSQHRDLLAVPVSEFEPLQGERFRGVTAYRTTKKVFGVERTVVVTRNEALLEGQMQGINANLGKAQAALEELQRKLRDRAAGRVTKGRPPTPESVSRLIDRLLKRRRIAGLIRYQVEGSKGRVNLSYEIDRQALQRLREETLGKTILFTDNHRWSTEEIVAAYRGQAAVEEAFKRMKDRHFLNWSPMFHWTDQKIRVHAFYCVLALTLCALLRRELHAKGIDLSIPAIIENLSEVREVLFVYPGLRRRKQPPLTLSERTPLQQRLLDALELGRYTAG